MSSFGTKRGSVEKRHLEFSVAGVTTSMPVFKVVGKREGPTLTVTAGIHGAEYASIEAALRLGRTLDPRDVRGRVVILPVVNGPSFSKRGIYVTPCDGKNLNRTFPGKAEGTFSEALSHYVFQEFIAKGDYFVDLHGGDMVEALVPFVGYCPTGNPGTDDASISMGKAFGVEYLVAAGVRGSSVYAAAHHGIPSLLAEAGGQGIWTEATVALHVNGVKNVMRLKGMLDGEVNVGPVVSLGFPWLFSEHEGLFYPQVSVGDSISEGQRLGSVCNFWGEELQSVISTVEGKVLFLMSSLVIHKGDPLVGMGEIGRRG